MKKIHIPNQQQQAQISTNTSKIEISRRIPINSRDNLV